MPDHIRHRGGRMLHDGYHMGYSELRHFCLIAGGEEIGDIDTRDDEIGGAPGLWIGVVVCGGS